MWLCEVAHSAVKRMAALLTRSLECVRARALHLCCATNLASVQVDNELTREYQRLEREFAQKKRSTYLKRNELLRHIDSFWCTALANSAVSAYLSELDKGLLYYLEAVRTCKCHSMPPLCLMPWYIADSTVVAWRTLSRV